MAKAMQMAALLVSLAVEESLLRSAANLKTSQADTLTWEAVCSKLMQKKRSQRLAADSIAVYLDDKFIAAASR